MTMEAHRALDDQCYLPARRDFENLVAFFRGPGASLDQRALEEELDARSKALARLLVQGWLHERSRADEREYLQAPIPKGVDARSHTRQIETCFGRVSLRRYGYKVDGQPRNYPLDKQLSLPAKIYSQPLQQRVVEEARDRSWDRVREQVDRRTGGHVPKRQAQEIAIDVTRDVDTFYKQREPAKPMSQTALLLGSVDCTGVRMLPEALREATRKAAAAEKAAAVRGDPMARKKLRTHDKRMAVVTATWEQEPEPRKGSDIVSELNRMPKGAVKSKEVGKSALQSSDTPVSTESPKTREDVPEAMRTAEAKECEAGKSAPRPQDTPPSAGAGEPQKARPVSAPDGAPKAKGRRARKTSRPQNKRVTASVQKSVPMAVAEMFDELEHRDPERARKVGVLVDGDEKQQTAILDEGQKRRRTFVLILDIIHVIHYLWLAGYALCHKNKGATETWLSIHLLMLLTSPVATVIAAIETAAETKRLSKSARKSVDKALGYLRRNAPFMDYARYLAEGFPIATGIIEGTCRFLIKDRLGITGAKWGLEGAEAMLRLRALYSSGDWDDYWRFHLKQEALRNYAAEAPKAA